MASSVDRRQRSQLTNWFVAPQILQKQISTGRALGQTQRPVPRVRRQHSGSSMTMDISRSQANTMARLQLR